jgi:predicted RNA-binding protein associated with RNAse of E/G family
MPQVEIHYRRPPDRLDVFVQQLVVDRPDCKITLHDPSTIDTTLTVGDRVIYEPGAPLVWFVFPGAWHDLGRFHLADATFTGYYVNLITPVEIHTTTWRMVDLCLDLWIDRDGSFQVLDQDEFDEAVDRGWIDAVTAEHARSELLRIIEAVRAGRWPPAVVREWDLERVRAAWTRRGEAG